MLFFFALMYVWQSLLVCFYLARVQILYPQTTFEMGSWYAVIVRPIQFALHLVQIPDFVIGKSLPPRRHNRAPSMLYSWCDEWGRMQLFHQPLAAHRPSYLTQRFQTLIHQSKGHYSTALLLNLFVLWHTGAFWHCFALSSILPYKPASQSLLLTVDVDTFFS